MDAFDLVAKLKLDSSGYEEGLQNAEKGASSFGDIFKANIASDLVSKGFDMAVEGAKKLGSSVVDFAKKSVDTGKAFDSSISQVAATMGNVDDMSGKAFAKLKQYATDMGVAFDDTTSATELSKEALRAFAQEMGANTAFSASQAADALNYMALAGYDATTSMDMLPNVLNLASAGGIDLAQASDMVTDAQSALGLSLDGTTVMVDQMAKASSKSNTSVAQLGEAFLTIGATARNLAGGTTELSTVLGVLADNGIKGAEGGTHLRNMLLALQTPTKDGTAALAKLGMTYNDMYDSAGNMRSLPDIMVQLQHGMEGMTQASKDAIISGIFNKTDLAAANALIGTSKERFDELTAAIKDSKGAAQEMADTQLDNLEGDVVKFQSALEGAQIKISDQLTPSLREFVQFGTEGISKIADGFQNGGLSGAMDAFGQVLSRGLAMITKKLPQFMDAGMKLLEALGRGIMQNIPMLTQTATQIILKLVQFIITNLPQLLTAAIQIIVTLVQGITEALPELIPAAVEAILTIVQTLIDNLPMIIDAAIQLITALTEGIINSLPILIEKAPEIIIAIVDTLAKNFPKILQAGIEIIAKLVVGLIQAIPQVVAAIPKIISTIVDTFGKYDWLSIGKNIIKGIASGIANAAGLIADAARNAAKKAFDAAKDFLGIHSPSTVFRDQIGKYMALGMAEGFEDNIPVDDMQNSLDGMVNGLSTTKVKGNNGNVVSTSDNYTFNIYQREGENDTEFARRIADIINSDVQRKRAVYA